MIVGVCKGTGVIRDIERGLLTPPINYGHMAVKPPAVDRVPQYRVPGTQRDKKILLNFLWAFFEGHKNLASGEVWTEDSLGSTTPAS